MHKKSFLGLGDLLSHPRHAALVVARRMMTVHQGQSLSFRTLMSVLRAPGTVPPARNSPPTTSSGATFAQALSAFKKSKVAFGADTGIAEGDEPAIDTDVFHVMETSSLMSDKAMDGLGLNALRQDESRSASGEFVRTLPSDRAAEDLLIAAVSASSSSALITAFRQIQPDVDARTSIPITSVTFEWLMQVVCDDIERISRNAVVEVAVRQDDNYKWLPHVVQQRFWKTVLAGYLLVEQKLNHCSDPVVWRSMLKFSAMVVDIDLAVRCVEGLKALKAVLPRDAMIAAVASARCERLDICEQMLHLAKACNKQSPPSVATTASEASNLLQALHEITVLAYAVPANATQVQDLVGQMSRLLASTDAGVIPKLESAVGYACGGLLAKAARSVSLIPRNTDAKLDERQPLEDTMGDPVRLVDTLVHALVDHSSEACVRHHVVLEGLLHALCCSPSPPSARVSSLTSLLFRQADKRQLNAGTVVDRFLCEPSPEASLDQLDNSTRVGLGALPCAVDVVAVRLYLKQAHPSLFFSALSMAATEEPAGGSSLVFARERHYSILVTGVVGLLDAMTPPPSATQVMDAVQECVDRAPSSISMNPLSPPTKVALQRLQVWLWSVSNEATKNAIEPSAVSLDTLMRNASTATTRDWKAPTLTCAHVLNAETGAAAGSASSKFLVLDDALFSWAARACSTVAALGQGWSHWVNIVAVLLSAGSVARSSFPPGTEVVLLSDQTDVLAFCFGVLNSRKPVLDVDTQKQLRTAEQLLNSLTVCDLSSSARIRWLQQQGSSMVQVLAQRSPLRDTFSVEDDDVGVFTTPLRDPALPKDVFESALPRLHAESKRAESLSDSEQSSKWLVDESQETLLAANLGMMIC